MTEGVLQKFKITKRYGRKVTANYQSYDFNTELTTDVEIDSAEKLIEASDKLFLQAKWLTEQDIAATFPQDQPGDIKNG